MQNFGTVTTHLFILAAIYICNIEAFTDEELEKIIDTAVNGDNDKTEFARFQNLDDIRDFKSRFDTMDSLNTNEQDLFGDLSSEGGEEPVRKRPFCNGFTGCGRLHGKRSQSSLLKKLALSNSESLPPRTVAPSVAKRPFCNGFFGCGNPGKRIVFRNANLVHHAQFNNPGGRQSGKRFFCNPGAFGCSNPGKRLTPNTWFEHLRSNLRDSDDIPPL